MWSDIENSKKISKSTPRIEPSTCKVRNGKNIPEFPRLLLTCPKTHRGSRISATTLVS